MCYVVIVSTDLTYRWGEWHSTKTNKVYYSDFITQEGVDDFIEEVKRTFPDSNLSYKCGYRYQVNYSILKADTFIGNSDNFQKLIKMLIAHPWSDIEKDIERDNVLIKKKYSDKVNRPKW